MVLLHGEGAVVVEQGGGAQPEGEGAGRQGDVEGDGEPGAHLGGRRRAAAGEGRRGNQEGAHLPVQRRRRGWQVEHARVHPERPRQGTHVYKCTCMLACI